MIGKADIRRAEEWMGHADIETTMKYLHYAPREGRRRPGSRCVPGRGTPGEESSTKAYLAAEGRPVTVAQA
jgi:hypothetical protein